MGSEIWVVSECGWTTIKSQNIFRFYTPLFHYSSIPLLPLAINYLKKDASQR
jgi:hypothetical protein